MAKKKKSVSSERSKTKGNKSEKSAQGASGVLKSNDIVTEQASASNDFVAALPCNSIKESEYGHANAVAPLADPTADPGSSALTTSTLTEEVGASKTGSEARLGTNSTVRSLHRVMKFPDLVHAVKPEPHHGMPQAASAQDTFWDFVSLMPESTHLLSDRGIPRSYRMTQGFGMHTFRLVNGQGKSVFCKFH